MTQLQEERPFWSQCFKKAVSDVTVTVAHSEDSRDGEYFDTSFLDTVDAESHSSWKVTVLVNNQPVSFKIDTGAEVSVQGWIQGEGGSSPLHF